jgi:hypothetical protein
MSRPMSQSIRWHRAASSSCDHPRALRRRRTPGQTAVYQTMAEAGGWDGFDAGQAVAWCRSKHLLANPLEKKNNMPAINIPAGFRDRRHRRGVWVRHGGIHKLRLRKTALTGGAFHCRSGMQTSSTRRGKIKAACDAARSAFADARGTTNCCSADPMHGPRHPDQRLDPLAQLRQSPVNHC